MNIPVVQIRKLLTIITLVLFSFSLSSWSVSTQASDCVLDTNSDGMADGTGGANSSSDSSRLACGTNSSAGALRAIAVGENASADGIQSTSVGQNAKASGNSSIALGVSANASGLVSVAIGGSANARSTGAISVGSSAGINGLNPPIDSPQAIAIGQNSNIKAAAPGAIAIGGDVDNDNKGAEATQPGAIAIGADVIADIPHTLVTNVPILAKDVSGIVVPRTMFEIQNSGNTKFNVTNTDANESWAFANPGTGFRLSRQGSGSVEFEVKNNGNAVLAGMLTENSDVNSKQDIQALDQKAILDKVMDLDISEWRYKDDPESKHIGPMAQDFYQAFELGHTNKGISTLDSSGVALAAIQALKHENRMIRNENSAEIIRLKNEVSELKALVKTVLNLN